MSIRSWIQNQEMHGSYSFSLEQLQQAFPRKSPSVLRSELSRLGHQHILANVHRGFYVKIPVQYTLWEILPPAYYLDQLMTYLQKPYYLSLLSAAQLYGAAHQAPQFCCVCTLSPTPNLSDTKSNQILWHCRQEIPQELLTKRNSETGQLAYSCPELTALDIVQYTHQIGGLSRSSTILAELQECLDFKNAKDALFRIGMVTDFQRLGFILEEILHNHKQGEYLFKRLRKAGKNLRWTALSKQTPVCENTPSNTRWKIHINATPELDEV